MPVIASIASAGAAARRPLCAAGAVNVTGEPCTHVHEHKGQRSTQCMRPAITPNVIKPVATYVAVDDFAGRLRGVVLLSFTGGFPYRTDLYSVGAHLIAGFGMTQSVDGPSMPDP
ncbi:hypothetical protein D3C84_882460 [compost metagenome]